MTKIGWTHWPGYIGHTLNLTGGCTHVHAGCKFCYAERMTFRLPNMGMTQYAGLAKKTDAGIKFTGDVRLFPNVLDQIATWTKPRCVFVNSMSDLFQEGVDKEFIFEAWSKMDAENDHRIGMGLTPHIFLFLTKRPSRMAELWREWVDGFVLESKLTFPNFGFGTSVSDQKTAEMMIPPLLTIEHGFRFVSVEPMIGPVDLAGCLGVRRGMTVVAPITPWEMPGVNWVLCGAESGPRRRPLNLDDVRSLRDECADAGVPFYLKQLEVNGKVTASPALDGVIHAALPKIGGGE